jgi:hypothetical protein
MALPLKVPRHLAGTSTVNGAEITGLATQGSASAKGNDGETGFVARASLIAIEIANGVETANAEETGSERHGMPATGKGIVGRRC